MLIVRKYIAFLIAIITIFYSISCNRNPTKPENRNVYGIEPSEWYLFPTWSPTGEWIAYEYYGIDSLWGIWMARPDGSDAHFVTRGMLPDFSSDGKKLALVRDEKIFMYDLETKELTRIASNGSFPQWSRNNRMMIVYASNANSPKGNPSIWIMDVMGNNKRELRSPENIPWTMPDWFPDYRIVHSRGTWINNKSTNDLFIMDTTASGVVRLTRSIAVDEVPKVSPDGKRIIWERWGAPDEYKSAIWLMNADGSNKERLTDGYEPDWSPDSRHIIFRKRGEYVSSEPFDDHDPKVHGSLWIMNVDTREQWQFLPKNQKIRR